MPVGSASARTGSGRRTRTLTALQVMSVLTLLSLAFQFATAGQLLTHRAVSVDVHGGGAIVLHVISGLTVVAAGLHWLKRAHDPVADRDRGTGVPAQLRTGRCRGRAHDVGPRPRGHGADRGCRLGRRVVVRPDRPPLTNRSGQTRSS